MGVTLDALSRRLAREVWSGQYPLVAPVSQLDAATTATSLVLSGAGSGRMSAVYSSGSLYAYDGVGVWMPVANSTATAPEGQYGGRVTKGGYAGSTGTFTLSPGFTTSPKIAPPTEPALVFLYGIDPWEWTDAINEVTRTMALPRALPVTMATDGEMEQATAASWTAVGGASLSKLSAAEGGVAPLLGRMLKVTLAASGDGVQGSVPAVAPGEVLSVWAPVAASGVAHATVALRDGSSTVASATLDLSGGGWVEARFQGSLSSAPGAVTVRITGDGAGTLYVGALAVHSIYRSRYPLPAAVDDAASLLAVGALPAGRGVSAGGWQGWSELTVPWPARAYRDYGAAPGHWLELGSRPASLWPLFAFLRLPVGSYSGPTATADEALTAPLEVLVEGCAAAVCDRLAQAQRSVDWARKAQAHRNVFTRMLAAWKLLPEPGARAVRRVRAL